MFGRGSRGGGKGRVKYAAYCLGHCGLEVTRSLGLLV